MNDKIVIIKLIASIVISLLGLSISTYLLITASDSQTKTWAAGTIGTIIGYWIK